MRPIDEMMRDAVKAASDGVYRMLINHAELRQLKDYELVTGTENPNVATVRDGAAVMSYGERLEAPPAFELHIVETLP
jgi:hypothetical protein